MADYYPLLARALDGLSDPGSAARDTVYERARTALHTQLRSVQPPLNEAQIARERASLEEAIGRVERARTAPGAPGPHPGDEPAEEQAALGEGRTRIDRQPPIRRGGRRGRSLLTAFGLVAVIAPIAVAAWLWRDQPAPAEAPRAPASPPPAVASDPKFPERVATGDAPPVAPPTRTAPDRPAGAPPVSAGAAPGAGASPSPGAPDTPSVQPDLAVAQKAAFVEENPADPQQPKTTAGRALWRLDSVNAGQGQALETIVRATVDVPDAGISLQLAMRRNRDTTLPASHTLELTFTTTSSTPVRQVRDVNLPLLRTDDGSRGIQLSGLSVPVKENLFLIGLSDLRQDIERNSELLLSRNWIELPLRFSSGQRATLVFEKGVSGDRVMVDAFKQWAQP